MTLSVVAIPEPSLVIAPADIAAHWELELSQPLEPLATERNLVVRSGSYVLREARSPLESVLWEHELLLFLAPRIAEVVAPLRARDGTTFLVSADRVVSVFPYVDAAPASRGDERVRAELPRLLARLYLAMREWPGMRSRPGGRPSWRDLDWVRNETWDWNAVEPTPVLERAYAAAREWLESPPPLTESAVHGDFHPENLLASDRGIEAVLDWEFARVDWPAADLAAAVTVLALGRDGTFDDRIAANVVAAYVDAGGEDESYALEPLIRQFLLAVALHGHTRRAQGSSWHPGFQAMIETALERFV
jgi:Ser/Thr protein kinase RdoA (MazF antagonist)